MFRAETSDRVRVHGGVVSRTIDTPGDLFSCVQPIALRVRSPDASSGSRSTSGRSREHPKSTCSGAANDACTSPPCPAALRRFLLGPDSLLVRALRQIDRASTRGATCSVPRPMPARRHNAPPALRRFLRGPEPLLVCALRRVDRASTRGPRARFGDHNAPLFVDSSVVRILFWFALDRASTWGQGGCLDRDACTLLVRARSREHVRAVTDRPRLVVRYESRASRSSRVIAAAPPASASAASASARLRDWSSRIRSSTVSRATMR